MEKYRVLIIQDNRLLRDEMVAKLKKYANMKVTGATGSSVAMPDGQCRMAPDVILMSPDVRLVRQVKELFPDSRLVATDVDAAGTDILALVGAGVCSFVNGNATCSTLVNTVKSAACRKPVIPLELLRRLAAQINEHDKVNLKAA